MCQPDEGESFVVTASEFWGEHSPLFYRAIPPLRGPQLRVSNPAHTHARAAAKDRFIEVPTNGVTGIRRSSGVGALRERMRALSD